MNQPNVIGQTGPGTGTDPVGPILLPMLMAFVIAAALAVPPRDMRPVTEGTVDQTPLARDLSVHSRDLRVPTGFDNIYEVAQPNGRRPKFARIHGALVAEFPRSEYVSTQYGRLPVVPAGTRYKFLRSPMPVDEGAPETSRRPTNLSADGQVKTTEPSVVSGESSDSMWQSEHVRRARVTYLLSKS